MPIVTIQVTREGSTPGAMSVTAKEKAVLSQLLLDILNKPLDSTFVVIEEVDFDNWAGFRSSPTARRDHQWQQRRARELR